MAENSVVAKGFQRSLKLKQRRAKKLTAEQVLEIRRLYATGLREWTYRAIGAKYGVNSNTVTSIINGRTWGWLK